MERARPPRAAHAFRLGGGAEQSQVAAGLAENHGDQEPQFAISEDGYFLRWTDIDLVEDLTSCGDRFGEYGFFIRDGVGHAMQILSGEVQVFAERSIPFENAEHRAVGTMALQVPGAELTRPAGNIDFSDNALSDERDLVTGFDNTDELMSY